MGMDLRVEDLNATVRFLRILQKGYVWSSPSPSKVRFLKCTFQASFRFPRVRGNVMHRPNIETLTVNGKNCGFILVLLSRVKMFFFGLFEGVSL